MNLEDLHTELKIILPDAAVEDSFTAWLNDEMLQLTMQFDFSSLRLRRPASLITIDSEWEYSLANDVHHESGYTYQKKVWRITDPNDEDRELCPIYRATGDIDAMDPDHDETDTEIDRVAVEDDTVAVYPMANSSLNFWYYRKPRAMRVATDTPDGLQEEFHYRVLIPRVVLRAFRTYPEIASEIAGDNTRALALWQARLQEGIYGSPGQIGLLDALRKNNPPRFVGPPRGSNLAGADYYVSNGSGFGGW